MDELYTTFEKYLHDELSLQEKAAFELQLQQNPEIREKFELYKETSLFLKHKFDPETEALRQNLRQISSSYVEKKEAKKTIQLKPWYYAVAAILVVALGTWSYLHHDVAQFADYDQHEIAMFTERGTSDANLKEAEKCFNAGKYKKAAAAFAKLPSPQPAEIQYFYAISLLEINEFSTADSILTTIKNGNSVYKSKAIWYLALSSLKQKNNENTKRYLRELPLDSEDFEKAQKLLQEL